MSVRPAERHCRSPAGIRLLREPLLSNRPHGRPHARSDAESILSFLQTGKSTQTYTQSAPNRLAGPLTVRRYMLMQNIPPGSEDHRGANWSQRGKAGGESGRGSREGKEARSSPQRDGVGDDNGGSPVVAIPASGRVNTPASSQAASWSLSRETGIALQVTEDTTSRNKHESIPQK